MSWARNLQKSSVSVPHPSHNLSEEVFLVGQCNSPSKMSIWGRDIKLFFIFPHVYSVGTFCFASYSASYFPVILYIFLVLRQSWRNPPIKRTSIKSFCLKKLSKSMKDAFGFVQTNCSDFFWCLST